MNLSIRELNELIYSLGITAHHGMLVNKELNESLLEKLYGELNSKLSEEEDDANYLTIPSEDEIRSHYISNEEADEDYRSTLKQDEQRYEDAGYKPKGITQAILNFVQLQGDATYTEMQNFYRKEFGSNSFSHILKSLIIPYKNRTTRRYLTKMANGNYEVKVAQLHNWIVKD